MKSSTSRILLLILVIVLQTVLPSQTDSGKICLTYPEFDFYAQSLVENKGLKIDTAILSQQILISEKVIRNKDKELVNVNMQLLNKDTIIAIKTVAFADLAKKYTKQEKKLKRFKQGTVIFGLTTSVLAIILLLK